MANGTVLAKSRLGLVGLQRSTPTEELQELLTVSEVAAFLKVSNSWVYEHTRSRAVPRADRLPYVKVGKYVRFDSRLIQEFLLKRTRIA
jgi:excisionase family DNA binding protein